MSTGFAGVLHALQTTLSAASASLPSSDGPFERIPPELILLVLASLGPNDLANLAATSRRMCSACRVDHRFGSSISLFINVWHTTEYTSKRCTSFCNTIRGISPHIPLRVSLTLHNTFQDLPALGFISSAYNSENAKDLRVVDERLKRRADVFAVTDPLQSRLRHNELLALRREKLGRYLSPVLGLICDHLQSGRVVRLDVESTAEIWNRYLGPLLKSPATLLRSFKLRIVPSELDKSSPLIPPSLFGRDAPALRTIKLHEVDLDVPPCAIAAFSGVDEVLLTSHDFAQLAIVRSYFPNLLRLHIAARTDQLHATTRPELPNSLRQLTVYHAHSELRARSSWSDPRVLASVLRALVPNRTIVALQLPATILAAKHSTHCTALFEAFSMFLHSNSTTATLDVDLSFTKSALVARLSQSDASNYSFEFILEEASMITAAGDGFRRFLEQALITAKFVTRIRSITAPPILTEAVARVATMMGSMAMFPEIRVDIAPWRTALFLGTLLVADIGRAARCAELATRPQYTHNGTLSLALRPVQPPAGTLIVGSSDRRRDIAHIYPAYIALMLGLPLEDGCVRLVLEHVVVKESCHGLQLTVLQTPDEQRLTRN
ncbi:hypothetical protein BKA62DRAFT_724119 [Auriculariales sp. MPI-PUGE-AT-0066]|nr:hypothetical protein BKA62DRAFT_724119 [Auriculariales sp. MPI-PUGE-AT-0066]